MRATSAADIEVHGAGPAGTAAAIAARLCGADVELYDPSPFPRHRVCGEFLSPGVLPILDSLGLADDFIALGPVRYQELVLQFGERSIPVPLPETAFGLSRYALDGLLARRALSLGVPLHRERGPMPTGKPTVIAYGRQAPIAPHIPASNQTGPPAHSRSRDNDRLFGFKAHFKGVPASPLTLFFAPGTYVGINHIEGGATNICGLASESTLRAHGFDVDSYLSSLRPLARQLSPLERSMAWMTTGPILFGQRFHTASEYQYPAGDAVSFVDPFTGSGILCALLTGHLAGIHAARGILPRQYLARCRRTLRGPYFTASVFRAVLATPFASMLAAHVPAAWLVRGTRPRVSSMSLQI